MQASVGGAWACLRWGDERCRTGKRGQACLSLRRCDVIPAPDVIQFCTSKGARIRFEWDVAKAEANEAEHGVAFDEATELWDDPHMVVVEVSRGGERRKLGLARMWGACWLAVYAQDGDTVHIILVRRATAKGAATYDREKPLT